MRHVNTFLGRKCCYATNFIPVGGVLRYTPHTTAFDTSNPISGNNQGIELRANDRTVKADPTSGLWIKASKAVIYAGKRISNAAKVLFIIIRDYQGDNAYAFPSEATLAADMDCSTRQIRNYLDELEAAGAIQVIERPGCVHHYRTCFLEMKIEGGGGFNPKAISDTTTSVDNPTSTRLKVRPDKQGAPRNCSSAELDSSELESKTVCEAAPLNSQELRLLNSKAGQYTKSTSNPDRTLVTGSGNTHIVTGNSYVKLEPQANPEEDIPRRFQPAEITPAQAEIAAMLQSEGVASVDAERIALTNPKKADVTRWIETARSKHNPGGYLKVVLDKQDARPPASPTHAIKVAHGKGGSKRRNSASDSEGSQAGPIDFSKFEPGGKYAYMVHQPTNNTDDSNPTSDLVLANSDRQDGTIGEIYVATGAQPRSRVIDPKLRGIIRQLDKKACLDLRQAYIESNTVIIEFYRGYQPSYNAEKLWLPLIKCFYEEVTEIRLI